MEVIWECETKNEQRLEEKLRSLFELEMWRGSGRETGR